MISQIDSQPAGSGVDLVKQVEEIFSPTGILSRSRNFEFRPQQQQMAVAVARALEKARASGRRGRHRRWQEPGLPGPGNSVCRGAEEEGRRLNAHDQLAGAAHAERPADARSDPAGGVQVHDAEGPGELSLHPPAPKGDAAIGQPVYFLGSGGAAADIRVVQDHHRRQPVGF